jgi:hypothetical protein
MDELVARLADQLEKGAIFAFVKIAFSFKLLDNSATAVHFGGNLVNRGCAGRVNY